MYNTHNTPTLSSPTPRHTEETPSPSTPNTGFSTSPSPSPSPSPWRTPSPRRPDPFESPSPTYVDMDEVSPGWWDLLCRPSSQRGDRHQFPTVITPTPPIYVDPRGPRPRTPPRCRRRLTYLPPPPTPPYSPPSPVINWDLTMKTIGQCWD